MPDRRVIVTVPGSSANLGPGYDCLGVALPLHLTVRARLRPGPVEVRVEGDGADVLPSDSTNLVARTLLQQLGLSDGLEVEISNALPLSAGCGSSAAAIVAAIAAADGLRGRALDRADLLERADAAEGHPDNVAASIYGGFTIALAPPAVARRIEPPAGLSFVLVTPQERLATSAARAVLEPDVAREDAVHNLQRVAMLVDALHRGALADLPMVLSDRLHEAPRAALMPTFARLRAAAGQHGALGVTLSGAGPSVLIWTARADAEAVAARVRVDEPGAVVRVLAPAARGVDVVVEA